MICNRIFPVILQNNFERQYNIYHDSQAILSIFSFLEKEQKILFEWYLRYVTQK